ncbi:TPA: DNA glycosylase [Pasteurella multocida]|uniref:DNA glycosylase n=1 Tax=Pasteurella multocida TaxID=747 RepID=UPI0009F37D0F|nr:DNA glycosylase [Pasteurella multocida]AWB54028.1 DNA glycosylase [Pasteurella multocida]MEB3466607.1 DNA glycosylase [Pasteurella multocida]MEB3477451.1 DNA glycosylase [Pasteurella multocida]MEB3493512.1 DNA glycosylase [Pasteurella multocida]PNM04489.1 DNA glycosylase [Pasteurella multocida]
MLVLSYFMSELLIETHPFPAIFPAHAKVMMMGTFPPKEDKRCMHFHYPNFQNDMWRIYGLVFFDDATYFQIPDEKRFDPAKIEMFLRERGIALCSTVQRAVREKENASDKFLTVVEPVDLAAALQQVPDCCWLFTTGGKATEIILSLLKEKVNTPLTNQFVQFDYAGRKLRLYRLPSTSRAYPMSLQNKAESYRTFFKLAGILP